MTRDGRVRDAVRHFLRRRPGAQPTFRRPLRWCSGFSARLPPTQLGAGGAFRRGLPDFTRDGVTHTVTQRHTPEKASPVTQTVTLGSVTFVTILRLWTSFCGAPRPGLLHSESVVAIERTDQFGVGFGQAALFTLLLEFQQGPHKCVRTVTQKCHDPLFLRFHTSCASAETKAQLALTLNSLPCATTRLYRP